MLYCGPPLIRRDPTQAREDEAAVLRGALCAAWRGSGLGRVRGAAGVACGVRERGRHVESSCQEELGKINAFVLCRDFT